jgi:hypothetical protein
MNDTVMDWRVSKKDYAVMGPVCGTPPLRVFRKANMNDHDAAGFRAQFKRRDIQVQPDQKIAIIGFFVEVQRIEGDDIRGVEKSELQSALASCSFETDCMWNLVSSRGILRHWWRTIDEERTALCCPEKLDALQTCGIYKERQFRSETAKPTVLASFPGSGNTWARLLLEFSSGIYTGSVYDDIDLMRLMPAEGLDSGAVIAVKAHLNPEKYMEQTTARRALLLVRHPFDAIWAEYQRRVSSGHSSVLQNVDLVSFSGFANCMACKWCVANACSVFQLSKLPTRSHTIFWLVGSLFVCLSKRMRYSMLHAKLASQHTELLVVRYEDLVSDTEEQIVKMLKFLGGNEADDERIDCAIKLAFDPSIRRKKKISAFDVFNNMTSVACRVWQSFSDNPHSKLLLNTLGYDNYVASASSACAKQVQSLSSCNVDFDSVRTTTGDSCSVGRGAMAPR